MAGGQDENSRFPRSLRRSACQRMSAPRVAGMFQAAQLGNESTLEKCSDEKKARFDCEPRLPFAPPLSARFRRTMVAKLRNAGVFPCWDRRGGSVVVAPGFQGTAILIPQRQPELLSKQVVHPLSITPQSFQECRHGLAAGVAMTIRLQDVVTVQIQCRQKTATKTIGIDTDQMTEIENVSTCLRGVTDEDPLAAAMTRWRVRQMRPIGRRIILVGHQLIMLVIGMNKDGVRRFVIRSQVLKKREMLRRDLRQRTAIAGNRCLTAATQPTRAVKSVQGDSQQHDLVIAAEGDHVTLLLKRDDLINDVA